MEVFAKGFLGDGELVSTVVNCVLTPLGSVRTQSSDIRVGFLSFETFLISEN